jgi:hypothetical protein
MSKSPLKFRESELRRVIRAVAKEGVSMSVEITPNGVIRISPAAPLTAIPANTENNPWDR